MIAEMSRIAEASAPITGRGVGYKLFSAGLIESMSEMSKVYRLLRIAREGGDIPWDWIVDETRDLEQVPTWADPEEYAEATVCDWRRDFWNQQPGPRRGVE